MSDVDLDRLEALARAATPGPWEAVSGSEVDPATLWLSGRNTGDGGLLAEFYDGAAFSAGPRAEANAHYAAAADPATVLALIAELRAEKAKNAAVGQ